MFSDSEKNKIEAENCNVGNYVPINMAPNPRRPKCLLTLP
jgi:hypothetical protein